MDKEEIGLAGMLPDAGHGYWWKVELIPGQSIRTLPIKISLMEEYTPGKRGLSRCLTYHRAHANKDAIASVAKTLLTVKNYSTLVGDFPPASTTQNEGDSK